MNIFGRANRWAGHTWRIGHSPRLRARGGKLRSQGEKPIELALPACDFWSDGRLV